MRRSTVAQDTLDGEKTLKLANATRWNSQHKMIKSILAISSDKLDSLDVPKLITYERNIIKEGVEILTPFEEATDFAQIEDYPSAGYVLPSIRGLEHQLNNVITKYHCSFLHALKDSLSRRMVVYEANDDYILAAILDPRFKLLWCRNDDEKKRAEALLTAEMAKVKPQDISDVTEEETSICKPPKKKCKIFTFMDEDRDKHTQSTRSITEQKLEIQKYLEDPHEDDKTCPLQYWKAHRNVYPTLAEVATTVLGIPASSAAVERLFRVAGKIFRPERCRLADSTFQKLMFIRSNNKYFKN